MIFQDPMHQSESLFTVGGTDSWSPDVPPEACQEGSREKALVMLEAGASQPGAQAEIVSP